jgi:hypothetical protein
VQTAEEHSRRPGRSRSAAFWLVAGVFFLLFVGAGAPSPLYGIYRAQLRFSTTTLTAIFATYALVLLLGVGAATGALGAALLDLQPGGSGLAPLVTTASSTLGLGVGALGTSALAQYWPAPTRLVWWLLLGATVVAAAGIVAMPEPGTLRPGALASLRPRVGVPRPERGTFAAAAPCLFAAWGLSGLYQSLGPSLATQVTGSRDLLWGGLLVFLLTGVAAAATVAFRSVAPRTAMLAGCLVLLAGLAVTFAAIAATTAAGFLAGTAVAGVGFGMALLGANRILIALAPPGQRAGLIAAIFIVNFLGLSIPALIAGVATAHFGLHRTALAYCVAMAALIAVAVGSLLLRGRHTAGWHEARPGGQE